MKTPGQVPNPQYVLWHVQVLGLADRRGYACPHDGTRSLGAEEKTCVSGGVVLVQVKILERQEILFDSMCLVWIIR